MNSFPPSIRLHTNRDFSKAFVRQQKSAGKFMVALLVPSKRNRIGIIVSKKIDKKAVRRHKLKRWIREIYRIELEKIIKESKQSDIDGYDLIILFKRNPPKEAHSLLREEIIKITTEAINAKPEWNKKRRK